MGLQAFGPKGLLGGGGAVAHAGLGDWATVARGVFGTSSGFRVK